MIHFACPTLIPCKNVECRLFREQSPFCIHLVTAGEKRKGSELGKALPVVPGLGDLADFLTQVNST